MSAQVLTPAATTTQPTPTPTGQSTASVTAISTLITPAASSAPTAKTSTVRAQAPEHDPFLHPVPLPLLAGIGVYRLVSGTGYVKDLAHGRT